MFISRLYEETVYETGHRVQTLNVLHGLSQLVPLYFRVKEYKCMPCASKYKMIVLEEKGNELASGGRVIMYTSMTKALP